MSYVEFNTELPLAELKEIILKVLGSANNISIKDSGQPCSKVIGVSDGRYPVPETLCFVEKNPANQEGVNPLKQTVVMTNPATAPTLNDCCLIVVEDPRALYIDTINHILSTSGFKDFNSEIKEQPAIHTSANIHPKAVIEPGVFIGPDTSIAAGCVIKSGTYLSRNVTVRENSVIGCDGIALYKTLDGRVMRFPHLAGIVIGSSVEIGASCVLPRGVLINSKVGSETVIGNLSNLGHAVQVGKKVWMSVGCLIGGNTTIGDNCTLGLGVSVRDNLIVGKNCSIGMGSVVVNDLLDSTSVFGNPARKLPKINAGPDR